MYNHPNYLSFCSKHVFADTMRSIAVLLAGGISYFTNIISPEVADASAALIVSLIIFLSCLPLFNGLYKTCREIIILKRGPPLAQRFDRKYNLLLADKIEVK